MSEETQNELIPLQKLENPLQIFNESEMDKLINEIKKKADDFKPDLSTDKSRREIATMAYKISRSKTALIKLSDDLTEEWKKKTKAVVQVRQKMSQSLDELRDQVRKPLTDWEDEQEKILAQIKESIENIRSEGAKALEFWMETSADRLEEIKIIVDKWECDTDNLEVQYRFKEAKTISLEKVDLAIEKKSMYDSEQAELKELREAAAARKLEDDARITKEAEAAAEAADKALIKANNERLQAQAEQEAEDAKEAEKALRIEQDRLDAVYKQNLEQEAIKAKEKSRVAAEAAEVAKQEAVKQAAADERQKIAAEENQRLADEKRREENKEHQRKINQEAVKGLMDAGLQKPLAEVAVKAIILGDVPHVKLSY